MARSTSSLSPSAECTHHSMPWERPRPLPHQVDRVPKVKKRSRSGSTCPIPAARSAPTAPRVPSSPMAGTMPGSTVTRVGGPRRFLNLRRRPARKYHSNAASSPPAAAPACRSAGVRSPAQGTPTSTSVREGRPPPRVRRAIRHRPAQNAHAGGRRARFDPLDCPSPAAGTLREHHQRRRAAVDRDVARDARACAKPRTTCVVHGSAVMLSVPRRPLRPALDCLDHDLPAPSRASPP